MSDETEDDIDLARFSEFANDPETKQILRKIEEKNRKPLNTRSMIEDAFFKNLGDPKFQKYASDYASGGQVKFTHGDEKAGKIRKKSDSGDFEEDAGQTEAQDPSLYEKACLTFNDLRDFMIKRFTEVSGNEVAADTLAKCIRKIEAVLSGLGYEIPEEDLFNPMVHSSGLKNDDILENAKQVEENTKRLYSTFPIIGSDVFNHHGRPCVSIKIEGVDDGKKFAIIGSVLAKNDFAGNEAIDYVRKNGKGVFSVKSKKLGRWETVSGKFDIFTKDVKDKEESSPADGESSANSEPAK